MKLLFEALQGRGYPLGSQQKENREIIYVPFGPSVTFIAGMPRRGTACVCQKPTPAVSKIASSIVSCSTTSDRDALAKSEGGMVG